MAVVNIGPTAHPAAGTLHTCCIHELAAVIYCNASEYLPEASPQLVETAHHLGSGLFPQLSDDLIPSEAFGEDQQHRATAFCFAYYCIHLPMTEAVSGVDIFGPVVDT